MSEPLDLFNQAVRVKLFDSLHDLGMEVPPPLHKKTPVRHFMSECMLECIFQLRKDSCFV